MTGARLRQAGFAAAITVALIMLCGLSGCGGGTTDAIEADHAKGSHQEVLLPHLRQKDGRRFSGKIRVGQVRVTADRTQVSIKQRMEQIRRNSPPARPRQPKGQGR
jgi:carbonic anhydrase